MTWKPFAFAILLASAAWTSAPRLLELARETWMFRGGTVEQRRVRMFGDFYSAVHRVNAEVPHDVTLALVVRRPSDSDSAVFFNYYAYPRKTRTYRSLQEYRGARHDPKRPKTLVLMADVPRVLTYEEAREAVWEGRRFAGNLRAEPVGRDFILPLASSADGIGPDSFVIEAVLETDAPATVTLTLEPSRLTKTLTLGANERRTFHDLVYQHFAKITVGWLRVTSDQPLRAAFRFVNRGVRAVAIIPAYAQLPRPPYRLGAAERLWLLNAEDRQVVVRINDRHEILNPRELRPIDAQPVNDVTSDAHVFAFTSTKDPAGQTHFAWPAS